MTISPHFQRQREAAKELDRIRFEARMRTMMWPRNEPALLLSLERYDHSARLMLDGLCQQAKLVKRSELNER